MGVLIDVAEGMEFLHYTANIIHGDLKPANVLLKASPDGYGYTAVVADFGLSRMLDATNESSIYRTTSLGTVNYMSPELLVSGRLTRKADSWAFGIIMIEIWTGESAYGTMSPAQIFFSLTQQHRAPACPVECPAEYASIVAGCLCMEPEERWDFGRILRGLKSLRPV